MNRSYWLLLAALLLGAPLARAEDGGEDAGDAPLIDAGMLPDASVGSGGADRDNEEGEGGAGRVTSTCRQTSDCDRGFSCNDHGRCVYVGVRRADAGGCLIGSTLAPVVLIFGLALRSRRKRGRNGVYEPR